MCCDCFRTIIVKCKQFVWPDTGSTRLVCVETLLEDYVHMQLWSFLDISDFGHRGGGVEVRCGKLRPTLCILSTMVGLVNINVTRTVAL